MHSSGQAKASDHLRLSSSKVGSPPSIYVTSHVLSHENIKGTHSTMNGIRPSQCDHGFSLSLLQSLLCTPMPVRLSNALKTVSPKQLYKTLSFLLLICLALELHIPWRKVRSAYTLGSTVVRDFNAAGGSASDASQPTSSAWLTRGAVLRSASSSSARARDPRWARSIS